MSLRDYCIQRTIKRGKEEKVYCMVSEANCLIDTRPLKGCKLLKRAGKIIDHDIYGIASKRIIDEWTIAISAYACQRIE